MGGVVAGVSVAAPRTDPLIWQVALAAIALAALGFVDDLRSMSVAPRLLAQLVLGAVAGWVVRAEPLWLALGAVVIALSVNCVNFMDGINGITALTIALWGASGMVAATRHEAPVLFAICAVTAAAAIAFLPANAPMARLFLGDVGSYLFGGLVGVGILVGIDSHVDLALLLAPLAVYAADTSFTLLRRVRRRQALLSAHRDHVYQRLVWVRGHSHVTVAGAVTLVSLAIVSSWALFPAPVASVVTALLLLAYLSAPQLDALGAQRTERGRDVRA